MKLLHTSDWHFGMNLGTGSYAEDQRYFLERLYGLIKEEQAEGLLLAGRCVSADSTAAGAIRVMPPCMGMGQAAGTAAAMAVKGEITPRQVDAQALREKLKENGAYL